MQKRPNVAIDGPAGAGKSTVAREVAKRLGLHYLDTGAMYRAITLKMIRDNIDLDDAVALRSTLQQTTIHLDDQKKVYLDGEDVTEEIRKPYINEMVSPVSAQSAVRRHLVALQQKIASETNGIIMEGRDTTSVVLPDADFKFYLDASLEERTRRRNLEQQEKGTGILGCFDTNWWPNGVVPYEFSSNTTADQRSAMFAAMAEWEAVANIDFRPHSGEYDYVFIQDSDRNSSFVGRIGGKQTINIYNWGARFIMAHELAHALGMWHEQSRTDRDTYVIIHWDRIEADASHNFDKETDSHRYGPYDFDSVMHYGQCSFSTCANCWADLDNCRTIETRPGYTQFQDDIGQRDHLSEIDILTMEMMYPEDNWVFVDDDNTTMFQFGTYLLPFRYFTDGASMVPAGGTVVVQPGTYTSSTGTYTKAMTIWAPLGSVTIK